MEPNYYYVRGQGWIAQSTEHVYKGASGKSYRVEVRNPENGELWFSLGNRNPRPGEHPYHTNGVPDWKLVKDHIGTHYWTRSTAPSIRAMEEQLLVTLVPHE